MRKFLASIFGGLPTLLITTLAFAQEHAAGATESAGGGTYVAIGAGFAMGIAVLGGALAQGKAASAALEGIARNPGAAGKVQTPMLLGLVFIETLVLFTFAICLFILGKI